MSNQITVTKAHDIAINRAPIIFSVLMSINVACYALCNVMMVKILEAKEASIFSMLIMMILAWVGAQAGDKLYRRGLKAVGLFVGGLIIIAGLTLCALDAFDIVYVPGPKVAAMMTGDSVFFTATYVLSDVFSEVFGYEASRVSNIVASVFTLVANLIAKLMTMVPVPEYAEPNEQAFDFIYGGGIYVAIAGVLIYMVGDWLNDMVFKKLKSNENADTSYGSYSTRTILSSLAGKSVDIALFTVVVFVPFSTPAICEVLGIESWGMTTSAILGNFLLGITFQMTSEIAVSPFSYIISHRLRNKIESKPTAITLNG